MFVPTDITGEFITDYDMEDYLITIVENDDILIDYKDLEQAPITPLTGNPLTPHTLASASINTVPTFTITNSRIPNSKVNLKAFDLLIKICPVIYASEYENWVKAYFAILNSCQGDYDNTL